MEVKFTDNDIVDANISFSKEYLTKAKFSRNREQMLKLLLLANQSIKNAINQLSSNNIQIKAIRGGKNIKQKNKI